MIERLRAAIQSAAHDYADLGGSRGAQNACVAAFTEGAEWAILWMEAQRPDPDQGELPLSPPAATEKHIRPEPVCIPGRALILAGDVPVCRIMRDIVDNEKYCSRCRVRWQEGDERPACDNRSMKP